MLAQYNGADLNETKIAWYDGTATLHGGEILFYNLDDTNAPVSLPAGSLSTPPTSAILARDLRGRKVTDGTTSGVSTNAWAGVVAPESSGFTGPCWVTLIVPRKGDIVSVRNAVSATKGTTVFGATTASNNGVSFADSTFNFPAVAVAIETKDNSGLSAPFATTLCRFV